MPTDEKLELWLWRYVDQFGKERVTTYRLSEADAKAQYGEAAQRVEGSLEVRSGSPAYTSDFYRKS